MYSVLCLMLVSVVSVFGKNVYLNIPQEQLPRLLDRSVDCVSKSGADFDVLYKIMAGNLVNNEPTRKFIYCFSTSTDLADKNGNINKDNVMKLVGDNRDAKKLSDVIDECNKSTGSDKYVKIYNTAHCFYQKSPILFKIQM